MHPHWSVDPAEYHPATIDVTPHINVTPAQMPQEPEIRPHVIEHNSYVPAPLVTPHVTITPIADQPIIAPHIHVPAQHTQDIEVNPHIEVHPAHTEPAIV